MEELEKDKKLNFTQAVGEGQKSSAETGKSLDPTDYIAILEAAASKAINEGEKYIDNKLETFEKNEGDKIKTLENRINRLEDKQINIIETLAIFAALFTFVSIEFQIFHSQFSLRETAGLSLIIFGGLIFFISAIDFFLKLDLLSYKKETIPPSDSSVSSSSERFQSKTKITIGGPGFQIRIAFFLLGIICIGVGVWLFATNKIITPSQDFKIENHGSSIQIQGNSIQLPANLKEINNNK